MGAKIISESSSHLPNSSSKILIDLFNNSLLFGLLRRCRTRNPCRDAVVEEDRNRLQLGEGHGPQGFLRGHG